MVETKFRAGDQRPHNVPAPLACEFGIDRHRGNEYGSGLAVCDFLSRCALLKVTLSIRSVVGGVQFPHGLISVSGNDLGHDIAIHIRESVVATVEAMREALVIHAQQVQNRRV